MNVARERHKDTPWTPVVLERWYRGEFLWVEHTYARGLEWTWQREYGAEHRAASKEEAIREAESAVDRDA